MAKRKKMGRRKRKRKNKRNTVNSLVVRGPTIVPDQMFTKLTYRSNAWLAEPNGMIQTLVFRGNSIFDPEFGSGTGQPLGRDQWANFYNNYQVMASNIVVRYLPTAQQGNNFTVGVLPSVNPTISGIADLQEQPYAKSHLISRVQDNCKTTKSYMKSGVIFGTKDLITQEDTQANQGANPVQQWYWVIAAANNSLSGTGQLSVDLYIEIDYYVRYFDRKTLPRS